MAGELSAGLAAAAAVTAELMAAGALCTGTPWAPLNAVAPLILSPDAAQERDWHPLATPIGLGITVTGITGWSLVHHALLRTGSRGPTAAWAAGIASAAALATFDYRLLPPARRPRFQRWLPTSAIVAKYAALAAVLALCRPQARS